ncbi:NAD(P)-binding protein [Hypoxylon fragiforme]|uniref:NAD(P)-binding protein n=1 Tax=Hypoxylon fragiforme TaxID=63214 RepID=UPI0020C6C1CF|nr:NAD(P)-binding protein [Hypoxylon fragiforme]KAI2604857.1 NAD(P)-binding protein [Hypoxylon fragiforme]
MAKYNKLANKHILVIGGTAGIGRGVVEASLESGARVTLSGSSPQSVASALASIQATYPSSSSPPPLLTGIPCDLSTDDIERALDDLLTSAEHTQPIDHIVLTAADPLAIMPLAAITTPQIRASARFRMEVPLVLGKAAARHLRRSAQCSLTLTTGGIAYQPSRGWSLPAFTGAGLAGLARNLALEMAPVRVNAVAPGFVRTGLWEGMGMSGEQMARELGGRYPTGKAAVVEEVAEAYVYLMKDGNATGEVG